MAQDTDAARTASPGCRRENTGAAATGTAAAPRGPVRRDRTATRRRPRAAIYVRRGDRADPEAGARQVRACRSALADHGLGSLIVDVFEDCARAHAAAARPGLDALLRAVRSGRYRARPCQNAENRLCAGVPPQFCENRRSTVWIDPLWSRIRLS
ncbi:hypothetical protein MOTC310_17840 [Methylobacterium oryzae]|uniref:Resolvase/invertase-type recombinase catalytic domain-containing protein n=1 Tax=Methylobacterium oryzae TaxID=334852 RepID=A0ABU7TS05_9HYPH